MSVEIIIYGAGERGKGIYNFFEQYNQETMIKGFCDENYKEIREIKGRKVVGFEEAVSYKLPFLISISDEKIVKQVKNKIDMAGGIVLDFANIASLWGKDRNIINRDFCASFVNAPHGRSFMSKEVFAYLAYRAGFNILEQKIIDWEIKDLDCISLIQKPYIKNSK